MRKAAGKLSMLGGLMNLTLLCSTYLYTAGYKNVFSSRFPEPFENTALTFPSMGFGKIEELYFPFVPILQNI